MKIFPLVVLLLIMGFPGIIQELKGQTKVFDQTITWEHTPYEHGGYGFYWWHRTDGYSIINYGDMPSDNWASPNNYYDGEFTMSVEVISQPTDDAFWLQFGIWGDYYKGSDHTETVAARQYVDGGSGSTGDYSLGSPAGWWNKQEGDPLDFSRAGDFYRIGVVLWDGDDICIPMGEEWNPSGCPENADKYFPLTIRIQVYASSGTYVPPITAPDYSIDYPNERTNVEVSSEDQYSYNSDFSSTVDGDDQYLSLTPGTDVYFRKIEDYSLTQTLTVPYRPGAPEFGIDFSNERTSETVSSEYQYSPNSDMSSSTSGDGSHVSLTPGSNIYFIKSATSSDFASEKQTLTVAGRPGAPSFAVEYHNERTSNVVSSEYQHSANSDMSSPTTGDGSYVSLTPGTNHYFRKQGSASAFASSTQELLVPARPAAPDFVIDYQNERTNLAVQSTHEYASMADMSDATSGTGAYVTMEPGSSRYFRTKPTSSAFLSNIQTLTGPARPSAPSFLIDYMKEEISTPIGTGFRYSINSDMSGAIVGSNNLLQVIPEVNIYFQSIASASDYASEIQTIVSPARPGAPSVGIDFASETTEESIGSDLQYSASSGFETAESGTGTSLDVVPGTDIYFRQTATVSTFSSEVFHLAVPGRPVVSSVETGSTALYPFIANFTFFQEVSTMDQSRITMVNAELNNLGLKSIGPYETIFQGLVYATANDVISIMLAANTALEGNFVSESYEISFTGQLPGVGIESINLNSFSVFPNPGKGIFHMKFDDFDSNTTYKVECCSITGKVVHTETFYGSRNMSMDLSGLQDGIYLIRLSENEKISGAVKLIIK